MMVNLHCQPDCIQSHLGDTPLGVSMKEFLRRFSQQDRITLYEGGPSLMGEIPRLNKKGQKLCTNIAFLCFLADPTDHASCYTFSPWWTAFL